VQDSATEWSKSVSLDTAGYHGVLEIPGKMFIRKVCVCIVCIFVCMHSSVCNLMREINSITYHGYQRLISEFIEFITTYVSNIPLNIYAEFVMRSIYSVL